MCIYVLSASRPVREARKCRTFERIATVRRIVVVCTAAPDVYRQSSKFDGLRRTRETLSFRKFGRDVDFESRGPGSVFPQKNAVP